MKRWVFVTLIGVLSASAALWMAVRPWPVSRATRDLRGELAGVTEVRIRSGGICHRMPEMEKEIVILQGDEAADFIERFRVDGPIGACCACCGEYTFEFYRGKKLVTAVSLHHWDHARWPGGKWKGDAKVDRRFLSYLRRLLESHGEKVQSAG